MGAWAPHDELLFIRLAEQIGAGNWLGPYDTSTLAKGMFFPLFILVNQLGRLPLKTTEHVIFLLAALFAASTLVRATRQGWLLLPMLMILALSPTPWMIDGARVIREPLYQSLGVALFCLAARHCLNPDRKLWLGLVFGLIAGCYWLTREEGVWLLPSLVILASPGLAETVRKLTKGAGQSRPAVVLKDSLRSIVPPLLAFMLVVLIVNSANLATYGVFRDNDFRSGPFPAAYGALARIKHDHWKRYVVFPQDARQRAYAVSPAARELGPYLDGDLGRRWTTVSRNYPKPWGCASEPTACHDEILSGWFIWALRDAVSAAGHYRSADAADAYYLRLADEINTACEREAIPCYAPRASLAPVWRAHYVADALIAAGEVWKTLATLSHGNVGVPSSSVTVEQARVFQSAINSQISGFEEVGGDAAGSPGGLHELRLRLTKDISRLYAKALPALFVLALFSYVFQVVAWITVKSSGVSTNSVVILTGLLAAIVSRVGLLGFLEATSFPSNNMGYLFPAVPFYLLFIVVSTGLAGAAIRNIARGKVRVPA